MHEASLCVRLLGWLCDGRNFMRRVLTRRPPLFFLMAGEPSGDSIGAQLMASIRREHGAPVRFAGVGGEKMAAEGLQSLFPMSELSLMGFAEVVPALPRLAMRMWQTISAARAEAPDVVVGIDSKAFCLRVLRALAADRGSSPQRCIRNEDGHERTI